MDVQPTLAIASVRGTMAGLAGDTANGSHWGKPGITSAMTSNASLMIGQTIPLDTQTGTNRGGSRMKLITSRIDHFRSQGRMGRLPPSDCFGKMAVRTRFVSDKSERSIG